MSHMFVIGEDAICCALGTRLVADVLGWELAQPPVNAGGASKLKNNLPRYVGLTHLHPVLCVADTDGKCAADLVPVWRPPNTARSFLLRFAVTEAESWLLADAEALANFFEVSEARIPRQPDELPDAKRAMVELARRSRKRPIRQEVVSTIDPSKPGNGYNLHLREFVERYWRSREAAPRSPSLQRAIRRLAEVGAA